MSTATVPEKVTHLDTCRACAPVSQRIVLYDISWETYEALLRDLECQHLFLTYDRGALELMSPLPKHDRSGRLLGRLLYVYTEMCGIPIASFGMTTWRRKDLAKGLEADECYYVRNEPAVRGREDITLEKDPPPDLAIEVDITRSTLAKQEIYASLGIPELWRYEDEHLTVRELRDDGKYALVSASPSFPDLPLGQMERFMHMRHGRGETDWIRAFRDWVAEHFKISP